MRLASPLVSMYQKVALSMMSPSYLPRRVFKLSGGRGGVERIRRIGMSRAYTAHVGRESQQSGNAVALCGCKISCYEWEDSCDETHIFLGRGGRKGQPTVHGRQGSQHP